MKTRYFSIRNLLLPVLILSAFACNPCGDPSLVRIPESDATPPQGKWIVTVLTQTPSGPISALTPYEAEVNNISVKRGDQVTVQWIARDDESGIKLTSMEGTFTNACNTPSGPISAAGMIPEIRQDLSAMTVCAHREWSLPVTNVDVNIPCGTGNTFSSGSYSYTGQATNMKGMASTSQLNIAVNP